MFVGVWREFEFFKVVIYLLRIVVIFFGCYGDMLRREIVEVSWMVWVIGDKKNNIINYFN